MFCANQNTALFTTPYKNVILELYSIEISALFSIHLQVNHLGNLYFATNKHFCGLLISTTSIIFGIPRIILMQTTHYASQVVSLPMNKVAFSTSK